MTAAVSLSSPHFSVREQLAAATPALCPICGRSDSVARLWTVGPELGEGKPVPYFDACRPCRLELGNLLRRYDRPRRRLNKRHAAALVFLARNPTGRAARADVAAAAGKYATNTIESLIDRGLILELLENLLELSPAGWAQLEQLAPVHAFGTGAGAGVHASAEYSNAVGAAAAQNAGALEQLATFNRARRAAGL